MNTSMHLLKKSYKISKNYSKIHKMYTNFHTIIIIQQCCHYAVKLTPSKIFRILYNIYFSNIVYINIQCWRPIWKSVYMIQCYSMIIEIVAADFHYFKHIITETFSLKLCVYQLVQKTLTVYKTISLINSHRIWLFVWLVSQLSWYNILPLCGTRLGICFQRFPFYRVLLRQVFQILQILETFCYIGFSISLATKNFLA